MLNFFGGDRMRIVVVIDIYGKFEKVKRFVGVFEEERLDFIFIVGDIMNFSGVEVVRIVFELFMVFDVFILVVYGNCDGRDVLELLEEFGILFYNKRKEVNGIGFVGVGGLNIIFFNIIWEFMEDEIMEILRKNYRLGDIIFFYVFLKDIKVDRVYFGFYVGSIVFREFIEKN